MLKELNVVQVTEDGITTTIELGTIEPSLFSFGTLIRGRRSDIDLGIVKDEVAKKCPNSIVGDFLTVFEMSNGEKIYIAEDYDWIRNHCSD